MSYTYVKIKRQVNQKTVQWYAEQDGVRLVILAAFNRDNIYQLWYDISLECFPRPNADVNYQRSADVGQRIYFSDS